MQFQKAVRSSGRTPKYLFTLADAYLQAGRQADARRILAELQQQSKTQYVSPDYLRRLSDELGK
jgi:predicted Zn-dependent protease